MKKILIFWGIIFFPMLCSLNSASTQEEAKKEPEFVGEFFGEPVTKGNYYFVKGAIMIFGNQWGPQPQTPQELEDCVWNDLLLSYEAFRRNIVVNQEEVESEITNTLKAEKVEFDWRKDKETYVKWVKEKINEPSEVFENQIRHLIQLRKLRQQVMDSIEPRVTDEEAEQEFLNEYNTLGIELVQFDELKDAQEFYKKAKENLNFWDKEKEKRAKDFKRPGFVALEFLMDMWKLPKEAVYKMMEMELSDIYPATPIYKGWGVFKVLEKRPADLNRYPQLKDSYYEQIKMKKKYEGFKEWVENLKEQANIKVYPVRNTIEAKPDKNF